MKIQFVVQLKSGLSYHRLINPMEFFPYGEGDSADMLYIIEDEHKINGSADILYFNKFIGMSAAQLKAIQKKGTKIVVDMDDSCFLPVNHPSYSMWNSRGNTEKVIEN